MGFLVAYEIVASEAMALKPKVPKTKGCHTYSNFLSSAIS